MSKILNFSLFESSIGSETIREKWYPKIAKRLFYSIINIDPTSIRNKTFSKPGKYSKWLLMKMLDKNTGQLTEDGQYFLENEKEKLNLFLFIFSTGWYKFKTKGIKDILKFKSLNEFMMHISKLEQSYLLQTKSKYDLIYSDDKVDIVVPLNYSASWETAKNTDWCTKNMQSWQHLSSIAILFRIIPHSKNYSKVKITCLLSEPYTWTMASEKYPEISGRGSIFDLRNGLESWQYLLNDRISKSEEASISLAKIWKDQGIPEDEIPKSNFTSYRQIEKTMSIVSNEAKKKIEEHFNKFKK